jgi:hypothetical protein
MPLSDKKEFGLAAGPVYSGLEAAARTNREGEEEAIVLAKSEDMHRNRKNTPKSQ